MDTDILLIDEAAAILRTSKTRAYELVRKGEIKAKKDGRVWKIQRSAIYAYLAV